MRKSIELLDSFFFVLFIRIAYLAEVGLFLIRFRIFLLLTIVVRIGVLVRLIFNVFVHHWL